MTLFGGNPIKKSQRNFMKESEETSKQIDDIMNCDIMREYEKRMAEKELTVKRGDNVVHVNYYEGIITSEDLNAVDDQLKVIQLELSSYDKSGVMYASLEDFTNLMNVVINHELTKNVVFGVVSNIVWETIKAITLKIHKKVKGHSITKISTKPTNKELTFGLHLSLNRNTGFEFRLDAKLSTETVDKALDKAKDYVKTQTPNESYKQPKFLYYDEKKNEWVVVDVMAEIRKQTNKKRGSKKKK